jgi:hypothetical protein
MIGKRSKIPGPLRCGWLRLSLFWNHLSHRTERWSAVRVARQSYVLDSDRHCVRILQAEAQAEIERKRREQGAVVERQRAADATRQRIERERKQRQFEAALARQPPPDTAEPSIERNDLSVKQRNGGAPRPADVGDEPSTRPVIKILKRDSAAAAAAAKPSSASAQPKKSLRKRTEEYAAARARIMADDGGNNGSLKKERPKEIFNSQDTRPIVREPRGPDGGVGFKQRRS